MTLSEGALTPIDLLAFDNDKPALLLENLLERSDTVVRWRRRFGGVETVHVPAPGFPVTFAFDRFLHKPTFAGASPVDSSDFHIFRIDFEDGGGSPQARTFDTIVLANNNFTLADDGLTSPITDVKVYATDDVGSFPNFEDVDDAAHIIVDESTSSLVNKRLGFTRLSIGAGVLPVPKEITAETIWIALPGFGVLGPIFPSKMGEVSIGRRRQLVRRSDVPHNDFEERSDVTDFISRSGVRTRIVNSRGQAFRQYRTETGGSLDEVNFIDWWRDSNESTRPFYYIENIADSPRLVRSYFMFQDTPRLSYPIEGPIKRTFTINMEEQAPFLTERDQGSP